jgi:hypothetical protein
LQLFGGKLGRKRQARNTALASLSAATGSQDSQGQNSNSQPVEIIMFIFILSILKRLFSKVQ